MWAALGHSHFLYVSAISNIVTIENGTDTKNVLKGTMCFDLGLVSSLLSSRRFYCSENKTIVYLDTVYCKFLLNVIVEINPFKHRYYSTQTNLVYLGLAYVTMMLALELHGRNFPWPKAEVNIQYQRCITSHVLL